MDIISTIKILAKKKYKSINQICDMTGLNSKNIWNKFTRGNIYFSEAETLLSALNYHIEIKPNKSESNNTKNKSK